MTQQSSVELASREQAATTLNGSMPVSYTVPVFAGNEAVLFPGNRERIMTGILGRPGMHSLVATMRLAIRSRLVSRAARTFFHFNLVNKDYQNRSDSNACRG